MDGWVRGVEGGSRGLGGSVDAVEAAPVDERHPLLLVEVLGDPAGPGGRDPEG